MNINKINSYFENDNILISSNMKPTYGTNEELNCGTITFREKPHLVFEKRVNGNRLNLKMVLPEEYDLQEQLKILNEKIAKKYAYSFI